MKASSCSQVIIPAIRLFIFLLITLFTIKSFAQETPPNKTESPYFFVLSGNPGLDQLPLKSTKADVAITGVIADVTVTQEYKNEGSTPLEAIYTFPASTRAAVYAMEMIVGDRKIAAKIQEKNKARQQYEEAKAEGKRTSLLEQHRPNVFQMNVANIMPGDEIKVVLKYTELLIPEAGTYTFVYPTVVGPRYSGETENINTVKFVSNPHTKESIQPFYDFDIDVNLSTGLPVQSLASTSHQITKTFKSTSIVQISLVPTEAKSGNRDFVLNYKLAGNAIESGLMLYEHGDENFFLLMVQPPKKVVREDIPDREYIFIVDVSGSMHGFPINTSKTLLRNLVVNLKPTDRFNILVFESGAYWFADESVAATLENVSLAAAFLDRQQGGGGTNLLSALKKAMSFPRHSQNLSRSFIVVTDGYVSVEKEAFDIIRKTSDQANLFAFGIGTSVNRFLIEGMAHAGQSEPFMVLNPSEADREAEKFRRYINTPVLTNIKSSISGFEAYDVEPLSIPDVLSERPVLIYGKYRGKPQGTITVQGSAGNKNYKRTFKLSEVKPEKKHAALRYLWARKKIQLLDDYNNLAHNEGLTKQVTDLGMKYNLLTAYTSFVAIEEKQVNTSGELTIVKQALPLPEGVENSAIGFEMNLDELEENISFHKKLVLSELEGSLKPRLQSAIEKKLLPDLNKFLLHHQITLHSVDVVVGMDGKVVTVKIAAHGISEEHRLALERLVRRQDFSKHKALRVWKFSILF